MADETSLGELERLAEAAALRDGVVGWRQLIETLPHMAWITRPDGWNVHFNQRWLDFTGLTLEESHGSGWNLPVHPDDQDRAAAVWEQATATGEPYEVEFRLRRHDGVYRWILGRALPLRGDSGTIVAWFGTYTGIEDLKRAQSELEHSRTLQRLASSMARVGGWSVHLADGQAVWSEELFDILGYPADHDPNLDNGLAMYPPEHRAELQAALERCATQGTPLDLELDVFDYTGNRMWVRVIAEAQYDQNRVITHLTGAFQDLTEQKETRRQKELLAQRLTTTLESITDGFLTVDRDWQLTYVNRRAEEMLGQSREELLGRSLWEAFPRAVDTIVDEVYHRAIRTGVSEVLEDFYWEPLDLWLTIHAYPSEQGLAIYFRDISVQHHAQQALRRLNEELTHANIQLEDAAQLKEDLLSMVSHELRTPLTPIRGFLETLRARRIDLTGEQIQTMLASMERHAGRMLRLVDDLLVVSHAAAGKLTSRPQEVLAQEILSPLVDELADAGVQVDVALEGCQLTVDPQHLEQIVLNLLTNAIKYGAPPIVVTAVRRGEERVVLEVTDCGPGVPPALEHRMWDRFVQSDRGDRRTATGVGLGLAIVKLLTGSNHGTVGYRNGSPTGAVFTVELPGRITHHGPTDRHAEDP